MADRPIFFQLTARDLALQHRDTGIEFGDRQRIDILTYQSVEKVVGTGRGVIRIHRAYNVDPHRCDVNKARESKGACRSDAITSQHRA